MAHNTSRPLRFGVVAPVRSDLRTWQDQVRRIAAQGYSTVLMPDVPNWQPAPAPTLAMAAAITELRVGTWVYASPVRLPWQLAWEAHSLTELTEGRFEFGLGMGRPGIDDQLGEMGVPASTPAERLAQVRDAISALRELDGDEVRTPVALAARGPKSRAMASELADTVTFPASPDGSSSRAEMYELAAEFRGRSDIELALHVSVIGEVPAPFMGPPELDVAKLHAVDSLLVLSADPAAAKEEILRRREEAGFSYIVIGSNSADTLAPVVAELAGR